MSRSDNMTIKSDQQLVSFRRESSVCMRLVKVPIVLFFLLSIIASLTMQFKAASRVHRDISSEVLDDSPRNPIVMKTSRIDVQNNISQSQSKENEYIQTFSQSYTAESRESAPMEGERNFKDSDLFPTDRDIRSDNLYLQSQNNHLNSDKNIKVTTLAESTNLMRKKNHSSTIETKSTSTRRNKTERRTRAIFGIMTYDSANERKRRGLIRSTFLSYFTKHMNRTFVTDEEYNDKKHWICSLNDLDNGRLEYPEKCRMAYAFVQGANPNGTTMLLNFNETYPLSLPPPKTKTREEKKDSSDAIYLNIKENGKFGKSPTWFRYAIDVLERHGWMKDWDYIFKADTDNLIYTPNFFRYMDKLPRKNAIRVFGGRPLDYEKCGGDKHDHCKQMIGPLFMAGGCYFLSLDLAKFISDETTFDHQAVKLPHEDMTTGNFVYSHPEKIRIIKEPRTRGVIRTHPVKGDRAYNHRWKKMLREEQVRLSTGEV